MAGRTMQTARKSANTTAPVKQSATSGITKNKTTRATKKKASKAKGTPSSSLFDTIVTILVGPNHIKFEIHKALLCHRSAYFKGALTGRFKEAREGIVTLEDEDPETFSRFHAWLYTGSCMKDDDTTPLTIAPALQLWLFAEKRLVPNLQNAIIDQLIKSYTKTYTTNNPLVSEPSPEEENACIAAWENSAEDSCLQKFITDHFLCHLDLETLFRESRAERYPLTLIVSIAIRAQKAGLERKRDFFGGLRYEHCARYHVHVDERDWCGEMEVGGGDESEGDGEGEGEEDERESGFGRTIGGSLYSRRRVLG